jgi:hypothetical protein
MRTQGNRKERRAEIIHKSKIFGGQTAEEVHQQYAFPPGARCFGAKFGCSRRPVTTFRTFIELSELRKQDEAFVLLEKLNPQELYKSLVWFKGSDGSPVAYMKMQTTYACKDCTREGERAAAKGPSWYVVEIDRGPGTDKIVSMASPEATAAVDSAVENMKEN